MNNKFDELAKSMAQSVTRRAALKKFGAGLTGMALACFGLANTGRASGGDGKGCSTSADCPKSKPICFYFGGSGSPRGVCVARVLL